MRPFRTYGTYFADGAATPKTLDIRLAQAGHDARIAQALKDFLNRESEPKLVGIMGGHGLSRSTVGAYAAVARLARHLTQAGYLIVTGGGPGAMEAGHLGATFSHASDAAFEQGLATLETVPDLPVLSNVVAANGDSAPGKECVFNKARPLAQRGFGSEGQRTVSTRRKSRHSHLVLWIRAFDAVVN